MSGWRPESSAGSRSACTPTVSATPGPTCIASSNPATSLSCSAHPVPTPASLALSASPAQSAGPGPSASWTHRCASTDPTGFAQRPQEPADERGRVQQTVSPVIGEPLLEEEEPDWGVPTSTARRTGRAADPTPGSCPPTGRARTRCVSRSRHAAGPRLSLPCGGSCPAQTAGGDHAGSAVGQAVGQPRHGQATFSHLLGQDAGAFQQQLYGVLNVFGQGCVDTWGWSCSWPTAAPGAGPSLKTQGSPTVRGPVGESGTGGSAGQQVLDRSRDLFGCLLGHEVPRSGQPVVQVRRPRLPYRGSVVAQLRAPVLLDDRHGHGQL